MKNPSLILISFLSSFLLTACGGGSDGSDGADGKSGVNAVVNVTDEPPGANCDYGGKRIDYGQDANRNGTLDSSEATTSYVCSADPSGSGTTVVGSLVKVTSEPAGATCSDGGQRVETGFDSDKDGTLDDSEVDNTSFICNGTDGTNGAEALVSTFDEPAGTNCANGGTRVASGIDSNGDGTLDAGEIDNVEYVCDGPDGDDGSTSLIDVVDEPTGTNCADGGKAIQSGVDDDNDGILDSSEVDSTSYVCDGSDGTDGTDGLTSLVNVTSEPAGENCSNGGQRIDSGLDEDDDGTLDTAEIDNTEYTCNLLADVLVETTHDSSLCMHGGSHIDVGFDLNENGTLESGEITSTDTICTNNTAPRLQFEDYVPAKDANYSIYVDQQNVIHLVGAQGSRLINPVAGKMGMNEFLSEGYVDNSFEEDFLFNPDYIFDLENLEEDPVSASLQGAPSWLSVEAVDRDDPRVTHDYVYNSGFPLLRLAGDVPDTASGTYNFDILLTDGEMTSTQPISLEIRAFGPRYYSYQSGSIRNMDIGSNGVPVTSAGFLLPFETYEGMSVTGSGSTGTSKSVIARFPITADSSFDIQSEFEGAYSSNIRTFGNGWGFADFGSGYTFDSSLAIDDWNGDGIGDASDQFRNVYPDAASLMRDSSGSTYFVNSSNGDLVKVEPGGIEEWRQPGLHVKPVTTYSDESSILVDCTASTSISDGDSYSDISGICIASVDTATGNLEWVQSDLDGASAASTVTPKFEVSENGDVFALLGDVQLVRFDGQNGTVVWENQISSFSVADFALATSTGALYIWAPDDYGSSRLVEKVQISDGTKLWSKQLLEQSYNNKETSIHGNSSGFFLIRSFLNEDRALGCCLSGDSAVIKRYDGAGNLVAERKMVFEDAVIHNGYIFTFQSLGRGTFKVEKLDASTLAPQ